MHSGVTEAIPRVPNAYAAIRRYGERGRLWLEGITHADPPADAVVADFAGLRPGHGMGMLRHALEHGIDTVADAPASLRALFAAVDAEPLWLEHARLDRAAGHLTRHTSSFAIVLGAASLTSGAMNSTAGLPLVLTGRYTTQAAVRSLEVGSWLEAILTPGGLSRDGAGFAQTLRVRIIHAFVRRHLLTEGNWDSGAVGAPIPQSFMAFTLAEFGHIALAAMHKLGVRYTPGELDDIYHLWRYVGHLSGVGPELNPADEADHIRIEELYTLTATEPSADDRIFVRALTHDYLAREVAHLIPWGGRAKQRLAVDVVNGLTRAFIGDGPATMLAVPDTRLKYAPTVLGPFLGGVNRTLAAIPGVNQLRTRRAFAQRAALMNEQRQRYGVTHDMVDTAPH